MKITKLLYLLLILFFSCGLETYIYLEPVENIIIDEVNGVIINLPSINSQPDEFRHYIIYYSLYLSDHTPAGTVINDEYRRLINPVLATHFNTLLPLTTNDIVSASTVISDFNRFSYFPLSIENSLGNTVPISSILINDGVVTIDFTNRDDIGPFVSVNSGTQFPLIRPSTVNPTPHDNNSLFYSNELISEAGQGTNFDVHRNTNTGRCYISMYIIAFGIDSNYSPIYSRATHLGIFVLPNRGA